MLGSLTVLPALLSRLGDKVDRGRVPLVGRLRRDDGEGRIWGAIVDRVLRRPALSAALAGAALLALAAPALQLRLAAQGPESFPKSRRGHQDLRSDAAGVSGLGSARERRRRGTERAHAGDAARRSRSSSGGRSRAAVRSSRSPSTSTDAGTVANITVPIAGNGTDAASNASFRMLRNEVVPETVGALPDTQAGVTGQTAQVEGRGGRS